MSMQNIEKCKSAARNHNENIQFETLSRSTKRFDLIECQLSDRHANTTKYRPYILEAEALFYRHYRDESLRKKYSYQIACQNNFTITKITIIINKDLEDTYEQKS